MSDKASDWLMQLWKCTVAGFLIKKRKRRADTVSDNYMFSSRPFNYRGTFTNIEDLKVNNHSDH